MCERCQQMIESKCILESNEYIAVMHEELEEQYRCIFYCLSCRQYLEGFFVKDSLKAIEMRFYDDQEGKYSDLTLIGRYVKKQQALLEQRVAFLGNNRTMGYEPIDEETFNELYVGFVEDHPHDSFSQNQNIVLFPSALSYEQEEEEEDEEWFDDDGFPLESDEPMVFFYPEPKDFFIAEQKENAPRYFLAYQIPASDFHPIPYVKEEHAPAVVLASYRLSAISEPQVLDSQTNQWYTVKQFLQTVHPTELYQHISLSECMAYVRQSL